MKKPVVAAIAVIAICAVIGTGYAITFYASTSNTDVDGLYFEIKGLSVQKTFEYDVDYDATGGTAGTPICYSTLDDKSTLLYNVEHNLPDDNYYLSLVSYSLYLSDGSKVVGTASSAKFDPVNATVVTGTTFALTLDYFKAVGNKLSFTLTGAAESDSGKPIYSGGPAPATSAFIDTVDIKIAINKVDTVPTPSLTSVSIPDAVAVGETNVCSQIVNLDGAPVQGYTVKWFSSAPGIARIADGGRLTGVVGSDISAVIAAALDPSFGSVSSNHNVYTVSASVDRYISIPPAWSGTPGLVKYPSAQTVTWEKVSGDQDISVNSSTGEIAVANTATVGDVAVIRAIVSYGASDGAVATDLCLVSVPSPSVRLSKSATSISQGGTETLTATTMPQDQTVSWTSSNDSIATVSDGTVTAVSAGVAIITATITVGGQDYSAECLVTVTGSAASATIYVKWVSPTNGLGPQGEISIDDSPRAKDATVTVSQNHLEAGQTLSSSKLTDSFAIVPHGWSEPTGQFNVLYNEKKLSSIGIEQGYAYDLYLSGSQTEIFVSFKDNHSPTGPITIGTVTVTASTHSVFVYQSEKGSTKVSSDTNTDKYSVDGGYNYTSFGGSTVYVGDNTSFIFSDSS